MTPAARLPRLLCVSILISACATVPAVTPSASPSAAPTPAASISSAVHWARDAAEHRALYLETYREAGSQLAALAASRAPQSWGVILDADETVLDNSEYELGRVPFGGSYDSKVWAAWVSRGAAPALPGSVAFTELVHRLGGKVVIVTNRDDTSCPVTRSNLERVAIRADLVLCKTTTDDKNPRFDAVQAGTAAPGFPALAVLEWIGDNIQDFPHLSQGIRDESDAAFSQFGKTFFALPNSMYGSWQRNPPR